MPAMQNILWRFNSVVYIVIFSLQQIQQIIIFFWNDTEKLNYKKKWENPIQAVKKVWPSVAALHKMARVKNLWIQVAAKKWLWWSIYAKIFSNNNSGEFCTDGHKLTWIVVINIFCHRQTIISIIFSNNNSGDDS